ncbi:MAG: hypothetical protein R2710_03400 [Acidimicrobiales bacterium]
MRSITRSPVTPVPGFDPWDGWVTDPITRVNGLGVVLVGGRSTDWARLTRCRGA